VNFADKMRRLFDSATVQTRVPTDEAVFEKIRTAFTRTVDGQSAQGEPSSWKFIATRPWAKYAIAAAVLGIIALLPLGYGATKLIKGFISIRQLPAIKPELVEGGTLSPDGKRFAGLTRASELVVIDTATGARRKLAQNCSGRVVWSADGSEIAAIQRDPQGGKHAAIAVSLPTGGMRTLMEDPPYHLQDWSPDGKLMLFRKSLKLGLESVVMIHLESKKETVLVADTGGWPLSARFSPEGDLVAYITRQGDRSTLHLRAVEGTRQVEYADFPGTIVSPQWSPDGAYVVFKGTQTGLERRFTDLWALRVHGHEFVGAPVPVVPDIEQIELSNWARNGQLACRMGFRLGGIFTLPVDLQTGQATGAPRQLVRLGGLPRGFCWSPDGEEIALCQELGLGFLSARTGAKIRDFPVPGIHATGRGLSWSPDGKFIAQACLDPERKGGVFLGTVATGEVRLLVPQEDVASNPTWSPDSQSLAYQYKGDIYVVSIADAQPRRLTSSTKGEGDKSARSFSHPVFAPDGGSVAYIAARGQKSDTVLATTIDGTQTREVFHAKDGQSVNAFDWSPDGRHIVFTPGDKEVWCVATPGGEPFRIADISDLGGEAWAWWPEWSPRGDAVIFAVINEKYKYCVMEDFLPEE
jgi:Tol biopolymer transport system component